MSIVERLGALLGHPVRVRSQAGKGSVFSIEVATSVSDATLPSETSRDSLTEEAIETTGQTGAILVVEDDPAIRDLIGILLNEAGHKVATALDGPAALDVVARGFWPDLLLTDYNLPRGLSGIELASRLRDKLRREIPVIILTGDISTDVLRLIANANCEQMNKPVRSAELGSAIDQLLMSRPAVPEVPKRRKDKTGLRGHRLSSSSMTPRTSATRSAMSSRRKVWPLRHLRHARTSSNPTGQGAKGAS